MGKTKYEDKEKGLHFYKEIRKKRSGEEGMGELKKK